MIVISLCISAVIKTIIFNISHQKKLPPGPTTVPVIGNFFWLLRAPFSEYPSAFRALRAKHGPIFTLRVGSSPAIFICTPTLAHQALVENGAT
ncbi:hypothetical protein RHMOL_Rhmol03G0248200 [Rhododendron molle]|uniref:Uncharacterized protein n=1 Tax=Rhododendron molle TaxID=49168 RepID=A0ACC0PIF5_RHOML|nr:hypothetical protein RHMOL_Rhmol03G0248200 [Rhododendron molle]